MTVTKSDIEAELRVRGISYRKVVEFLKRECKLDRGFEAMAVGSNAPSATTSGLITYVLAQLDELETQEQSQLKTELLDFELEEGFGRGRPTVWTTSQCLMGLLSLEPTERSDVLASVKWLRDAQSSTGGWSFSGTETERIVYLPYAVLALEMYENRFETGTTDDIERALEYAREYECANEVEKLIQAWLLGRGRTSSSTDFESSPSAIDYHAIVSEEFNDYIIHENTFYPFSFQYYTPGSYLFTRSFSSPDHPFNQYLIKYLVERQIQNRAWPGLSEGDEEVPTSFTTALAILTLYWWAYDIVSQRKSVELPTEQVLEEQIRNVGPETPTIFISYSHEDKQEARMLIDGLEELDYDIWIDEEDIKVGDVIVEEIGRGIEQADFISILLSESSVDSNWVKKELNRALTRELNDSRVVVLPVLLEECDMPEMLADKKYADARESIADAVDEMTQAIRAKFHEPS